MLKQKSNKFSNKCIDKRLFGAYNTNIEQLFGTIVRGGFTMRSERVQKRTSKKARIRRTKLILRNALLTVCIIALLAICSSAILTKATSVDDNEKVYYKYYAQIEIQKGDSLWSLAGEYMENGPYESKKEYMEEVAEINQLSSTTIFEGQSLIVPYYEDVYK